MNKTELVGAVADKADISVASAEKAVKAFTGVVSDALTSGDRVQLIGFGTFETVERAERKGHNPKTKEEITIPASTSVKFKAGKALKDAVNA